LEQRHLALEVIKREVEAFDWSRLTEGRQRVLEAFLVLAAQQGYASVTMRSLGDAVHVKAPSLYKHFRNGREEVVHEALRWHYYRFAVAVLDAVKSAHEPIAFWDALVELHVRRQLVMPESDMFDLLIATDRVSQFLTTEARKEVTAFLNAYAALFEGAASDMGFGGPLRQIVAMTISILDDVRDWSEWSKNDRASMEKIIQIAVDTSHALLEARAVITTRP
jgi:AcrR family transcriptional regulator